MGLIKDREWKKEKPYHTDLGFILSMGNRKMGKVMSFSLPPIKTCNPNAPCKHDCYAVRIEKIRPSVRDSWQNNLDLINEHWGTDFVNDISAAIRKKKPELFRWHVAGDIIDTWYLDNMCIIAEQNKDVRFWAFTKQFDILERYTGTIPDNLTIILSVWPPLIPSDKLKKEFGCCYFQDKDETYDVPDDAFVCEGDCEMCCRCVELDPEESVVIYKH